MSFPGTYNFSYYKGDTFEFKIYPKNSNRSAYDLSTYDLGNIIPGDGANFVISTSWGSTGVGAKITCVATISLADNSITCTISPALGNQMNANTSYVYDVEISKGSGGTVFTLLTGNISVTDQVSGATA